MAQVSAVLALVEEGCRVTFSDTSTRTLTITAVHDYPEDGVLTLWLSDGTQLEISRPEAK